MREALGGGGDGEGSNGLPRGSFEDGDGTVNSRPSDGSSVLGPSARARNVNGLPLQVLT